MINIKKNINTNNKIDTKNISVVVQGAVDLTLTPICLKSIRKYLPNAEIVLSTWKGSEIDGLDYDKIVLNDDPGTIEMGKTEKNNIKRQILSTLNGIKKTTGSYVLKIRSDMCLSSSSFLNFFNIYNDYNKEWKFVDKRILVSSIATRDPREWECSYSLSDWIYFGSKDDLLKVWDIPFPSEEEENWFNYHLRDIKTIYKYPSLICRYNPEQFILVNFAKKFINKVSINHMFDNNENAIKETLNIISNNFVVLSPNKYGFKFLKKTRKGADRWHILTFNTWKKLYNNYSNGNLFVSPVDFEKISYLPNFLKAKLRLLKQIKKGIHKKDILYNIKHIPWKLKLENSAPMMSVVVPCHGRIDLLRQTLESLVLQTTRCFNVIITDDSSNEEERRAIYDISRDLLEEGGIQWKYIFTEANLGQVENTNQGLRIADGEFVRILHSDDVIHPQTIKYETNILKKHSKKICCLFHDNVAFCEGLPQFQIIKDKRNVETYGSLVKHKLHSGTAVPSSFAFPRKILQEVGLMDTQFKRACDWDFFYRFIKYGKQNNLYAIRTQAKYIGYRKHANNNTNNPKTAFVNFFEYDLISKKIAQDMADFGFSDTFIEGFMRKAATYRYFRLIKEIKQISKETQHVFKDIIWKALINDEDLKYLQ